MVNGFRIAIICPEYSSEGKYSYGFVHARAKLYSKSGVEIKVFIQSKKRDTYIFEGIKVIKEPKKELRNSICEFDPGVLAIHYPHYKIISLVRKLSYPKVVWIHGHEILWNFRLRSSSGLLDFIKKRIVLIPREIYQKLLIRNFLKKVNYNIFVSNWMLKTAEKHTRTKFPRTRVIPNPVDMDLFYFQKPESMCRGVSLRSLDNTKYGIDIAIRAFSNNKAASLDIVGDGRFKKRYLRLINRTNSNALILDQTVNHDQLPAFFHRYDFFVAPSRVEAQGLAMCEAMACGLPVVATNVGGIPEFVRNGVDGYLVSPDDPEALNDAIKGLLSSKDRFMKMSENCRQQILKNCSSEIVTAKEIHLLKKVIR